MNQKAISTALFDPVARQTIEWEIHWLFRIALFCEFVGHGAFGVLVKAAWVRYFGIFGIPDAWAWKLMPVVGSVDITLGVLTLLAPRRACLLYMSFWSLFTTFLRPLAGEGWWEFFERSYNFGVPLLMLWVHGPGTNVTSWFAVITAVPRFTSACAQKYQWALQGIMASMLIGHGGFALVMGKQNLINFYDTAGFGVFGVPLPILSAWMGGVKCCWVYYVWERISLPFSSLCVWKLGTEFLHVPAQAYGAWWEVMERGSGYVAPLLWIGFHQFVNRTQCHSFGVGSIFRSLLRTPLS